MKTKIVISTILATILLGSALNANALHDSVAAKASQAIANPSVHGEAAAQAQVEEAADKEAFLAKQKEQTFAQDAKKEKAQQVRNSVNKELQHHSQKAPNAPQEVTEAFKSVITAMQALNAKKTDEAKQSLQKASTLFTKALKDNPSLGLVPVADDVQVDTFEGDAKVTKQLIDTAQKLLKNYDTQAARAILLPMKDEMRVSTEYLPMKIYPLAIKQAQKELDKGDQKRAMSTLLTALDTMVIKTVTVPVSLLTAQDLITVAAKLDKSKKKEATDLLNVAEDELKKGVLLGYVKKHQKEYKIIQQQIKDIKKEIQGKNRVEQMYDTIKTKFNSLLKEIRKDIK